MLVNLVNLTNMVVVTILVGKLALNVVELLIGRTDAK
jgi:hypothetical protein